MKTLSLFLAFIIPSLAYAGGGWVSNGIDQGGLSFGNSGGNEPMGQEHQNYFLLESREKSLSLGVVWLPEQTTSMNKTKTRYEVFPIILFSYGISKNWTWSNYLDLRYNLYSFGRHDLALTFGPAIGGMGYQDAYNFYMAPGLGLMHSFYLGSGLRLSNQLSVTGFYQSKDDSKGKNFAFDAARLSTQLSSHLWNFLTLWAGVNSYAGFQRTIVNDRVKRDYNWKAFNSDPYLGLAFDLGKNANLGFNVKLDHNSFEKRSGATSTLGLTVKF